MCRKNPKDCKVKRVCNVRPSNKGKQKVQKGLASSENCGKISLNDIDSCFQEQQYIVYVKGE